MPSCPDCSRENPEGFRFCGFCSAPLGEMGGGVRKTVSIVFTDVVGSTALAETLDAETLGEVMVGYFSRMREVLQRHGGTVEKFIGDAVMAVFGHPVLHEDDALRSVRAAHEMREALAHLNQDLRGTYGVDIATRTGVNTGEVVAADPTSDQTLPLGDAANVAARLEQAAGPGEILLGDATYRLVKDAVVVEDVEPLSLKGKEKPVPAWRLVNVIPGASAVARRLDSPMVGREKELAELVQAFERAVGGPGCELMTVVGIAGVGKSRLTMEFLSRVSDRARVLRARCLPYGEGITFWPVAELVRKAAGIEEGDSPAAARKRIEELLPVDEEAPLIRDRVAAAVGLAEGGGAIQETFWAVRRLLEALARSRPLVAVVDDINWAEPTFLDLLEYVAGFATGHPLLLLCTARPELRDVRPEWGLGARLLFLEPLTEEQSGQLITNLLGRAGVPEAVRARIVDAAGGNPLFVEEMLRMLIDDGLLEREDGHWLPRGDLSRLRAPATIQALITARLDRLDEEERAIVQRASVVGKVFWWGAVTDLSPEDRRGDVGKHLQTLMRKELIRPEPSAFAGEDSFRFSHILVRDVAYEAMSKRLRVDLHERFALWLERTAGSRLAEYEEILGYHLEQAHRYLHELGLVPDRARALGSRAAGHLRSAGLRSFSRGDMPATVKLLSRAIALLPPEDRPRPELLVVLGGALTYVGELSRADDVLSQAIELAHSSGDERWASNAGVRRLFVRLHTDPAIKHDDVFREADRAVEVFEELNDDAGLAEAWRLIGTLRFWRGSAASGQEAMERSITHARASGDHRGEMESLKWFAMTLLYGPTPAAEAIEHLERLLEGPGRTDRVLQFNLLRFEAELVAEQGDFDRARELVGSARSLGEELAQELDFSGGLVRNAGRVEMLAGDPHGAEVELRPGFEVLQRIGDTGHLSGLAPELADTLHAQGEYEEADSLTRRARDLAIEGDADAQILWRRVRAKVLARQGQVEQAEVLAREAVEMAGRTDYLNYQGDALADLAEVLRIAGRPGEAAPILLEAVRAFERKGNVVMAGRARSMLAGLEA